MKLYVSYLVFKKSVSAAIAERSVGIQSELSGYQKVKTRPSLRFLSDFTGAYIFPKNKARQVISSGISVF